MAAELEKKADEYANNLVDVLRDPEAENKAEAKVYFDAVTRVVGLLVNEESASLLRRRAAA